MQQDIQADLVLAKIRAATPRQVFETLAAQISRTAGLPEKQLLEQFLEQEKNGSGVLGDGVCIPHLKLRNLSRSYAVLATLDKPVAFEGADPRPVDIVCTLLSPEQDGPIHLRSLSRIARALKNDKLTQKLRDAKDADTIRFLLIGPEGWLLAA